MSTRSIITTHVLDTARGAPAAGMPVSLHRVNSAGVAQEIARTSTDADGRVNDFGLDAAPAGNYQLHFDIAAYAEAAQQENFFPEAVITFTVTDTRHHHVPLLLSPFAYSTYRGS